MSTERDELCGATTVWWPDDECIDVGPCIKPEDHEGQHEDDNGWEWGDWD